MTTSKAQAIVNYYREHPRHGIRVWLEEADVDGLYAAIIVESDARDWRRSIRRLARRHHLRVESWYQPLHQGTLV